MKLVRSGTGFSGYFSPNGTSWTPLGAAVTLPLSNDMLAGLAVSAVNNSALNTSAIDNVWLTGFGSPVTPTGLTASQMLGGNQLQWNSSGLTTGYPVKRATERRPLHHHRHGNGEFFPRSDRRQQDNILLCGFRVQRPRGKRQQRASRRHNEQLATARRLARQGHRQRGLRGNADYENGVFTVRGSGADIWNTADSFNFCYRPVSGNASITARVTTVQNTSATAKAGVMFRDSTTSAGGRYAMISVSPGAGIKFEYRASNGGTPSSACTAGGTLRYTCG